MPSSSCNRAWTVAIAVAAALALAACGSASTASSTSTATAPLAATPTATSDRTPVPIPPARGSTTPRIGGSADVIRAWTDALRHGDIDGAVAYFAVPATVSNGTGPIVLRTRAAVRFFNETLPCGAILVSTRPGPRGLVIATFRLTERPGAGTCGNGTGNTAQTAFRIRNGRIVDWLRLADIPDVQGTPA